MPGTPLPYTFYDHYTTTPLVRKVDRRQPLPSTFAPRFIESGTGAFNTSLKIWREGLTTDTSSCAAYTSNAAIPIAEVVRFDEHENATIHTPSLITPPPIFPTTTPATSQVATSNSLFPPLMTSGDVGGWMYLNLNSNAAPSRPSQAWVITSMFADPTYAVEATALALGNGCSPAVPAGAQIGPATP